MADLIARKLFRKRSYFRLESAFHRRARHIRRSTTSTDSLDYGATPVHVHNGAAVPGIDNRVRAVFVLVLVAVLLLL